MNYRQRRGRVNDIGWLIALPAKRNRCEIGRVCFHQQRLWRKLRRHLAQHLEPGIGELAGKADEETHLHRLTRMVERAGEAVKNSSQMGSSPMLPQ